jgi:hypothetical protein
LARLFFSPKFFRMSNKRGPAARLHTCGRLLSACTCCRCDGECGMHSAGECEGRATGEKNKRCSSCTTAVHKLKETAKLEAERARWEEEEARQRAAVQEGLREQVRTKEEEVRERDLKIQELEAMGAAHEAAVQDVRRSGRVAVAERSAVQMDGCMQERETLLAWLAKTKARSAGSSDPEDGWDIISGQRKVLAVPNPDQLPAPEVEGKRRFDRFRSLPEAIRLMVHSWCIRAATWSMRQLPHLREAYAHAFVLLYQGPNSPAQVPHIDLLPGAYQGSLACTVGPSTQIFLPEESPSAGDVAGKMGVSVQNLMRDHSVLFSMRDLLLVPHFQDAFPSQEVGDACLMEGGIVHRGPATQGARTSSGRLQLFWVVTPTYHVEHYNSDSQTWVGEVELQMGVEGEKEKRDALVKRAAERIVEHWDEYPSSDNMPWNKLEALYKDTVYFEVAKQVAKQAKRETLKLVKRKT